ncbi:hypothetical protein EI555_003998 [Monodon monoceros]|uniref:UDP-glucuronic acid decarboxylase 1 n=1 Tax=Monodon monoceros TaxID=40151 RepID=A0A4U1F5C3_MONMO|nr:hypothetical protein EI555_003998 [Monodon monoceros]
MLSQALLRLASAVSRRRMKLLLGIALLAYVACLGMASRERHPSRVLCSALAAGGWYFLTFSLSRDSIACHTCVIVNKEQVTGGAGFVGSHLTDKLMMDGHEVTVVDNFFTGRKRNVEHWIGHENFELINHDVVEPLYIEVDQIYHLASPASPPSYMYNPIKTLKTNTIGTLNMLGLAKRVGARLLLASTSEVYGDPEVHPQTEDYWGHVNPIGPRACYDEGKRVAETMCYAYMKQANVSWAPPSGQAWHSGEGVNEFESRGSWEARVSAPDGRSCPSPEAPDPGGQVTQPGPSVLQFMCAEPSVPGGGGGSKAQPPKRPAGTWPDRCECAELFFSWNKATFTHFGFSHLDK